MLRKLLAKHKRKLNSIFGIMLCMALLAGLVFSVDISAADNAAEENVAGEGVEEADSADDTAETQGGRDGCSS
ncbi:MAG: hypothetical protein LUC83_08165 [Clostridiales bacterium]|nr:hypothetical protein [Clostridiales bacterium]